MSRKNSAAMDRAISGHLVGLVQIVFGFVLAQTLVELRAVLLNPFAWEHSIAALAALAALAVLVVLITTVLSWIDWHATMELNPQEKAAQKHFKVLSALHASLTDNGWRDIEEIPSAIDLRATSPNGAPRLIFEVKTITAKNELEQCRAALSQLLEHRFFHGALTDELCLIVNGPIADRLRVFLESIDVGVAQIHRDGAIQAIGLIAGQWPHPFGAPRSP